MVILNAKGNVLGDYLSVRISPVYDKENKDTIMWYNLVGTLDLLMDGTPQIVNREVVLAKYDTEDAARKALSTMANRFGAIVAES